MKSILISIPPEQVVKILNGEQTIIIRKTATKCDLPIDVYIYCTKGNEQLFKFSWKEDAWYDTFKSVKDIGADALHALEGDFRNTKVIAKFRLKEVKTIYDRPEGTCDLNPNVPHPNWHHFYQMGFVSEKLLYGGDENTFSEEYGELLRRHSCLSQQQIFDYLNKDKNVIYGAKGYAWFISDLVIFDEPKELSDFMNPNWDDGLDKALERARKEDEKISERIYSGNAFDDEVANYEELTLAGFELSGRITKAPKSWCYVEAA